MSDSPVRSPFLGILAGLSLGCAFLYPETHVSAVLGWVTALLVALLAAESRNVLGFYLVGIVSHVIAFFWLAYTVETFGGFGPVVSFLLLALFCVVSSLQFVIVAWLLKKLGRGSRIAQLSFLPFAWFGGDFLTPKLFPWELSYTQVSVSALAGSAEYLGAKILSAIMIAASAGVVLCFFREQVSHWRRLVLVGSLVAALGIGWYRNADVKNALQTAPRFQVGVVQGNLGLFEKRDVNQFEVNIARYRELSQKVVAEGADLVVWPESVVNRLFPNTATEFSDGTQCIAPSDSAPFLLGGLTVGRRPQEELERLLGAFSGEIPENVRQDLTYQFYNTAFAVDEQCRVLGRYHKRILMPFGEYLPFADRFPSFRALSPNTGRFDMGTVEEPFVIPLMTSVGRREARVMPLICYEDLIPALSAAAIGRDAEILINLTNDAWYGRSAAPYQHHLLAQWRALETRRYLVRATNTGFTAVVDPFGRTLRSLPLFEEGALVEEVALISGTTVFQRFGQLFEGAAAIATAILFLARRRLRYA